MSAHPATRSPRASSTDPGQPLDALILGGDRHNRYGPQRGWSSGPRDFRFALATVPTGPDEAEDRRLKFYELRDNLVSIPEWQEDG
jgi:hypothetical protein